MSVDKMVNALPVTRQRRIADRPEFYHLRVLYHMAMRCGHKPLFVESGVTNGAAAITLRAGNPEADVFLVGPYPEHLRPYVDAGTLQHVESLEDLNRSPDLLWVGRLLEGQTLNQILSVNPRVLCIYDIYTAAVFQLPAFEANHEVARELQQRNDRTHSVLDHCVTGQQTRRGLLISEARIWSRTQKTRPTPELPAPAETLPAEPDVEETAEVAEPPKPRKLAVFQRRAPQIPLATPPSAG